MDQTQEFLDHVEDLADLELAVLLSLVAQQHCIVSTTDEMLDDLAAELALIARDMFNLSYIILEKEDLCSIDAFGSAILDDDNNDSDDDVRDPHPDLDHSVSMPSKLGTVDFRTISSSVLEHQKFDSRKVVNVVIAKDFNTAHADVQAQALELIRRRRIYSRTTMHRAPKVFLLLPLITTSSKHNRLNKHLNDRIFMSHFHSPDDGFPNLEELDEAANLTGQDSSYSFDRSPSARRQEMIAGRRIDAKLIERLRSEGQATTITPEIRRYLQDVVAFLRLERGVDGGVSPYATTLFLALAKYLAPFHGIDYVTPSLIGLAAKKVYPHRIIMATPSRERSTQYGTDLATATDLVRGLNPEKVIQNVLDAIDCPV